MAAAMGSAGRRATRVQSKVCAWHYAGLLAGSMTMASIVAAAAAVTPQSTALYLGAACVPLALLEAVGARPPQSRWQVPEYWRRSMDPDISAAAYGFILGFGVFTAVMTLGFWAFLLLALTQPALAIFAAWACYVVGRSFVHWRLAARADSCGIEGLSGWTFAGRSCAGGAIVLWVFGVVVGI